MHYIKDIFGKKETEHAHNKFIRYSKGNFVGPLVTIRISASQIKVAASFHYNDELQLMFADILGNDDIHVKGSLVWNKDLGLELAQLGIKYSKVTKSRGIFKYALENDVPFKDFINAMGKYNLIVSVKNEEVSLVTKPNFPKPNKEFGADFCKAVFPIKYKDKILKEFAFDVNEDKIKKIIIKHEIDVNDIDIPNIDNFEEARRLAKRIGEIRRSVSVNDSEEKMSKINFNL